MNEEERIELYSTLNRLKDDLWSVRFELKAQKDLLKAIEDKLKPLKEKTDER